MKGFRCDAIKPPVRENCPRSPSASRLDLPSRRECAPGALEGKRDSQDHTDRCSGRRARSIPLHRKRASNRRGLSGCGRTPGVLPPQDDRIAPAVPLVRAQASRDVVGFPTEAVGEAEPPVPQENHRRGIPVAAPACIGERSQAQEAPSSTFVDRFVNVNPVATSPALEIGRPVFRCALPPVRIPASPQGRDQFPSRSTNCGRHDRPRIVLRDPPLKRYGAPAICGARTVGPVAQPTLHFGNTGGEEERTLQRTVHEIIRATLDTQLRVGKRIAAFPGVSPVAAYREAVALRLYSQGKSRRVETKRCTRWADVALVRSLQRKRGVTVDFPVLASVHAPGQEQVLLPVLANPLVIVRLRVVAGPGISQQQLLSPVPEPVRSACAEPITSLPMDRPMYHGCRLIEKSRYPLGRNQKRSACLPDPILAPIRPGLARPDCRSAKYGSGIHSSTIESPVSQSGWCIDKLLTMESTQGSAQTCSIDSCPCN